MTKFFIFILLLIIIITCKSERRMPTSDNFDVHELTDGVYALIHKFGGKAICNSGIIDLGDTTIVFDTFLSPIVAEEIPKIAKQLNLSPIKYVVNSHWHDDHIRGNQVFDEDVKIISTKRTTELIEKNEPEYLAFQKDYAPGQVAYYDSLEKAYTGDKSDREYQTILMWLPYYQVLAEENQLIKTRLPNMFINKEKTLTGSRRSVRLISNGAGHTESDIILYLPEEKIVFTGDLVFSGMHPYLAHGDTDKLKEWMTFIEKMGIHQIVPGHGPLGNVKDLNLMVDYVTALEEIAANLIKENKPLDPVEMPEPFNQWWFERFAGWNMEFVYNNLKDTK